MARRYNGVIKVDVPHPVGGRWRNDTELYWYIGNGSLRPALALRGLMFPGADFAGTFAGTRVTVRGNPYECEKWLRAVNGVRGD